MLSTITPTNCWTKNEDKLADIMAGLATVHSFLGVVDKAAAIAGNMWVDAVDMPPDAENYTEAQWLATYPSIIVGSPGSETAVLELARRASVSESAVGKIEVILESLPDTEDTIADQMRKFKNSVGDILEELIAAHLNINSLTVESYGAARPDDRQISGDALQAVVEVLWGFAGEESS